MLEFSATSRGDADEIRSFLQRIFSAPPQHVPFQPAVMNWKAWDPHPLWNGSRSYVLRKDGQLAAHGCVTPMECLGPEGPLRTCCVIDWAADPAVAGAGVLLFRKIAQLRDGLTAVGGSDDTRKVLPRMGFQVRGPMMHLVRVVRPVRHQMQSALDWKTPARLLRDSGRLYPPLPAAPRGWTSELVSGFDERITPLLPAAGHPAALVTSRSPALLNYFLACPVAEMRGGLALHNGQVAGFFVLAARGSECRLADLGARPGQEEPVLALALAAAAAPAHITRIRWSVTVPRLGHLGRAAGLRLESEEPVFYWNAARRPGGLTTDFSMSLLDNDFFYL